MSDLSKYPALERKKSGIYAVRLRVPKDLFDFVDADAEPWNAISLHPGSLLNAWRDALATTNKVPSCDIQEASVASVRTVFNQQSSNV